MKNVRIQEVTLRIAFDTDKIATPADWPWAWIMGAAPEVARIIDQQDQDIREPTAEELELVGEPA